METLRDEYGYDDDIFVSEAPEYVHCILCSFVLRDPIQFLRCGHKLCSACFYRMKSSAENNSTELLCPVDRDVVSMSDVREDVAVKRLVGNLLVRCFQHRAGCAWTGDLRDLDNHVPQCQYQPKQPCEGAGQLSADQVKKISNRLDKYESSLLEKDKEIASLKYEQQHLKDEVIRILEQQQKQQQQQQQQREIQHEVDVLKKKNEMLVQKVCGLEKDRKIHEKTQQQQQHKVQCEIDILKKKNGALEHKVLTLEKDRERQQKQQQGQQSKIDKLNSEVKTLQKELRMCRQNDQALELNCSQLKAEGFIASGTRKVPSNNADKKHVAKKEMFFQHHSGDPKDATLSADNHSVKFHDKYMATVSAQWAHVPQGSKAWFEVECNRLIDLGWITVGWATAKLPTGKGNWSSMRVGGGEHSYGFRPFTKSSSDFEWEKWEKWGKKITSSTGVVGVALDLRKGEVLFSVDGQWASPMGVAFTGIRTDTKLFPAISGWNSSVCVNFGDRVFKHGPPDSTFEKLIDVIDNTL